MTKRSRGSSSAAASSSTGEAKDASYGSDDGPESYVNIPYHSPYKRPKKATGTLAAASAVSGEAKEKVIQYEEEKYEEKEKIKKREDENDDDNALMYATVWNSSSPLPTEKVFTEWCSGPPRPMQTRKRKIRKEMYECWAVLCMYLDSLDYQSVIDLGRDYGATKRDFWKAANGLMAYHEAPDLPDDNTPYKKLYSMCKLFPRQFKYLVLMDTVKLTVEQYEEDLNSTPADNELDEAGHILVRPKIVPTIYSFPPPAFENLP